MVSRSTYKSLYDPLGTQLASSTWEGSFKLDDVELLSSMTWAVCKTNRKLKALPETGIRMNRPRDTVRVCYWWSCVWMDPIIVWASNTSWMAKVCERDRKDKWSCAVSSFWWAMEPVIHSCQEQKRPISVSCLIPWDRAGNWSTKFRGSSVTWSACFVIMKR